MGEHAGGRSDGLCRTFRVRSGDFCEGENGDGGVFKGHVEGFEDGEDGGAGGEDVVYEEEGGGNCDGGGVAIGGKVCGGETCEGGGVYLVDILEFGFALGAGEVLVGDGLTGFEEEAGKVGQLELGGEGLGEEVEGSGLAGVGLGLVVVEGADEDRRRRQGGWGFLKSDKGLPEPVVEIGLGAAFKFQQAA